MNTFSRSMLPATNQHYVLFKIPLNNYFFMPSKTDSNCAKFSPWQERQKNCIFIIDNLRQKFFLHNAKNISL